jgi:predicted transcriptional regulator
MNATNAKAAALADVRGRLAALKRPARDAVVLQALALGMTQEEIHEASGLTRVTIRAIRDRQGQRSRDGG